ncbi:hypothetical protein STENM223S_08579 [Streptomyces tendae]
MRGAPEALVISKVIFFSEVGVNPMTPAPLPEASTAPVSWLSTRYAPTVPEPDARRTLTFDTVVAEPHFTDTEPVEPDGDQYVPLSPSTTLP